MSAAAARRFRTYRSPAFLFWEHHQTSIALLDRARPGLAAAFIRARGGLLFSRPSQRRRWALA